MKKIEGKIIVDNQVKDKEIVYEKINSVEDYEGSECIVVNIMDPDLFLIFGKVNIIISKRGSKLSHLAILAREYKKTVIIADCSDENIPQTGNIKLRKDGDCVDIHF